MNLFFSTRLLRPGFLAGVLLFALVSGHSQTASTPAPSPTAGTIARFVTDTAVRDGMVAIRAAMAAQGTAIAANQLDAPAYMALGHSIESTMLHTLAQRQLPHASAVAFQGSIWQDLEHGVGLMRSGRSVALQRAGALGVQQVLRNYTLYFEHPGW